MDSAANPDQELLEASIVRLARLGIDAEAQVGDRDRRLYLRWPGGETQYGVETKRGLRPALLGAVAHQLRSRSPDTLLVADYVSPPLAERLRELGLHEIQREEQRQQAKERRVGRGRIHFLKTPF